MYFHLPYNHLITLITIKKSDTDTPPIQPAKLSRVKLGQY